MSVEQVETIHQNVEKTINTLSFPADEEMLKLVYNTNYDSNLEEDVINAYVAFLDSEIYNNEIEFVNSVFVENYFNDPKLTEEVKKKIMVIIQPMIIDVKEKLLSDIDYINDFLNIH